MALAFLRLLVLSDAAGLAAGTSRVVPVTTTAPAHGSYIEVSASNGLLQIHMAVSLAVIGRIMITMCVVMCVSVLWYLARQPRRPRLQDSGTNTEAEGHSGGPGPAVYISKGGDKYHTSPSCCRIVNATRPRTYSQCLLCEQADRQRGQT
jgi:hypothetical protein